MAFIIDSTVINIKLTDIGRQLLSRGELSFDKYGVGDSEIDYLFFNEINFDPTKAKILRPKDNNPNINSFITREIGGDNLTDLGSVVSNTSTITNTSITRGFFDEGNNFTIKTDSNIVKQPDIVIKLSNATGSSTIQLNQSSSYGVNPTEPIAGDYLLVRWTNPELNEGVGGVSNFVVDNNVPFIWYKIQNIISGSLSSNNLIVELDKPTPNFNGLGSTNYATAILFPNSNNRAISGDSIQNFYGSSSITDFISEAVLAFIENYDTPTIDVSVWNMTIIFTKDVEGVGLTDRNMGDYHSKEYAGFVQYIQKVSPEVERLGVIHYTNNSPSNNYGEGFIQNTPIIELPTIMWHKNTNGSIGLTLSADTTIKVLSGLTTTYQDLVDENGNVVGKVFLDLKIFVIEDQELIYAISYKSNRSWTLPEHKVDLNAYICP